LSASEAKAWRASIRKAADYLTRVMSPEFASINYCATTTASLAMTNLIIPDERYSRKARQLAIQVIAKMDEDGFITGEGGRIRGVKYGVDLAYALDMSLWGLGLYARVTGDSLVNQYVRKSLRNHLYFVYPNGAIDGSWGIRSNKWTTYGSQTADGCQILFRLYAPEDARYRTAALRNLRYLRTMMKDGMIGYGPHYWRLFDSPPCIYPTFVRAKNLALAIAQGEQQQGAIPDLPADETGWSRLFPTVDVALVRSKDFMATITAYRYKDVKRMQESKYMHRPTGGSISNLWVEGHGFLQTSSQTTYRRWEPMHFPEAPGVISLTPRIEYRDESGYYTNLYEFDGRLSVAGEGKVPVTVSTSGELKDETQFPGGVAYIWTHTISDATIEKTVHLRYHGRKPQVRIIEPIVQQPGMSFELKDARTVLIRGGKREFRFEIVAGNAAIELGKDESRFWYPFPPIKCYPIVLIPTTEPDQFTHTITYRISVLQ